MANKICLHYLCISTLTIVVLLSNEVQSYVINTADPHTPEKLSVHRKLNPLHQVVLKKRARTVWKRPIVSSSLYHGEKRTPRSRREVKGELISPSRASLGLYSSIVYISVGCTGTLISDRHVLTAAHCIFDGKSIRKGRRMSPLKVGFLQGNGRFHKIRVRKVFVSSKIKGKISERLHYDYAVLKLVKPHSRNWIKMQNQRVPPRFLTFSSYRRRQKRRALVRFSYCSVLREGKFLYLVRQSDCPSEPGTSGAPIFSSNGHYGSPSTLGIVSAAAVFKSEIYGSLNVTVIKKFTNDDIQLIENWMKL